MDRRYALTSSLSRLKEAEYKLIDATRSVFLHSFQVSLLPSFPPIRRPPFHSPPAFSMGMDTELTSFRNFESSPLYIKAAALRRLCQPQETFRFLPEP